MRKSRIEAASTRERIVTAAAAEFRQHGIAATGLADLMEGRRAHARGLLPAFRVEGSACRRGLLGRGRHDDRESGLQHFTRAGGKGLEVAVADYLSTEHRDNPRDGCPLAALGAKWRGPTLRRGPPQRPGS